MEEPCSLAVHATLTESWDDRDTIENILWTVTSRFRVWLLRQVHTFSLEKCVCFWVQKNQLSSWFWIASPCEAVLYEVLSGVNGWKTAAAHKPWWEMRLQQLLHATKPRCLKTCNTEILSHLRFNSPIIFRRHWSKEPCISCCIFLAQSTTQGHLNEQLWRTGLKDWTGNLFGCCAQRLDTKVQLLLTAWNSVFPTVQLDASTGDTLYFPQVPFLKHGKTGTGDHKPGCGRWRLGAKWGVMRVESWHENE